MTAYLPYYGKLLRAKITVVFPARDNQHFIVRYLVLSEPKPRSTNECCMKKDSTYEVYRRPGRTS
jgi:hypothetical protein